MTDTTANNPGTPPERSAPGGRVHFCQGGLGLGGVPPVLAGPALALLPLALLVLPVFVLSVSGRITWLPRPVTLAIASVTLLAGVWWAWPRVRHAYRRGTDISGLPLRPDPAARVNVFCWNDQRRELETLEDIAFEPEQFRAWIPNRPPPWMRRLGGANAREGASRLFGALWGGFILLVLWLPRFVNASQQAAIIGSTLALALAVMAWMYRKPTYLRVAPGRAELRRYPFRGDGPPDVETFDLRTQPVRLDTRTGLLHVGAWRKDDVPGVTLGGTLRHSRPASVRIWATAERERAERLLYLACISTAEAPPMDDDATAERSATAG